MQRSVLIFMLVALLSACSPGTMDPKDITPKRVPGDAEASPQQSNSPKISSVPVQANFPNYGPAPELTNQVWLNTDRPLQIADLRGKVILIDMWTFG